jgi:hypothetical protein
MGSTDSQTQTNPGIAGLEATVGLNALGAETRLAALMAGARARGVADAFDALGIGAVLIDADGAALHVNSEAAGFMGASLGICARQLVAGTYAANARLQRALDLVLSRGGAESVELGGEADMRLHVLGLPAAAEAPTQLLKAVIVFERGASSCGELALAARLLRNSARLN